MWTRPFYQALRPLLIPNWPDALHALSVPSHCVALRPDESGFLAHGPRMLARGGPDEPPELADLLDKVETARSRFRGGAFLRLATGSAKDTAIHLFCRGRYPSAMAFVKAVQGSGRLQRHLRAEERLGETTILVARRWANLTHWGSLRLFVLDGVMAGLTQTDLSRAHPALERRASAVLDHVAGTFLPRLLAASRLRTYSADIALAALPDGEIDCRLIELNPGNAASEPYLYDWTTSDFDGGLRLLRKQHKSLIEVRIRAS